MREEDDDRDPRGGFRQGPSAPPVARGSAYRERGQRDGGRRPPMRPSFPPPPRQSVERDEMREMEDFLFGPKRHGANVPPRPRADAGTPDDAAVGLPGDERQADAS
jgi:hypothetical protein